MLGLLASITNTHLLYSNQSYGIGKPDCLLIPKPGKGTQGIILEFKHLKNEKKIKNIKKLKEASQQLAKKALEQIDMRGYSYAFHQHTHIDCVLKVGIAFLNRTVSAAVIAQQIDQKGEVTSTKDNIHFYSAQDA